MVSGKYEYLSDFARRYVAQGRAEGRVEERAQAILAVLAERDLGVPDDVRARITSCTDLVRLHRWLARAVTATSAIDVVSESPTRRKYEYQSDFARRHVMQGRAEGFAEAFGEALAHAIPSILTARGLEVPDEVRARIMACTDLARLQAWLVRAVTARSAAEVVRVTDDPGSDATR